MAAERGGGMNLLFSMADQLRFDALSSVTPSLKTPHLDRLASEGVRFTRAYSSTPTCTPARAALLTGRSPWNHGMLGYGTIAKRYPTFEFPRALVAGGYESTVIGKDHFGWNNSVPGSGGGAEFAHDYRHWTVYDGILSENDTYRQWFAVEPPLNGSVPQDCWPTLDMNSWSGAAFTCEEHYHPTAWTGRAAVAFLDAYAGAGNLTTRKPFLLKVSFHRPHSPYDPPARLLEATRASDMPVPARAVDGWSERYRECDARSSPDAWCGEQPAADELLARRAYHANVAFVDEQIGLIHDALQRHSLLKTTLWLFTSDHGDGQGDHFHWRKGFPYEFSSHIPMLLRWPEDAWPAGVPPVAVPRGSTLDALVELRDVAPTLLHAAGVWPPAPALLDGDSLLCLLLHPSRLPYAGAVPAAPGCPEAWRVMLSLEHDICYNASNHWNALTNGTIKYVYEAQYGHEQLFDLVADPHETRNLAVLPQHSHTLASFRSTLVKQFEDEERGEEWVHNGKLVPRPTSTLYSPNYPSG